MTLIKHREYGHFKTVSIPPQAASLDEVVMPMGFDDALVTVWEDGHIANDWTFAEVRARANSARL